ncbi:MAG: beta-N-acetylhexosaminidase [Bacteroidales bacterium]|jgi:hexosaminidase|nr:beta-N-acetylhexosaminidase [Bacteroidales bacterium]
MKKLCFAIAIMAICVNVGWCQKHQKSSGIIPAPLEFKTYNYGFKLDKNTKIIVNVNSPEYKVAEYLHDVLDTLFKGMKPILAKQDNPKYNVANSIIFILSSDKKLGKEGYVLDTKRDKILIEANENAGFFYAVQSLLQYFNITPYGQHISFSRDTIYEPSSLIALSMIRDACKIVDYPRFAYRGKHLDVCRHFFIVDEVKTYIDLLAYNKINYFHWHLTDDQGWRIEIKKYPLLNQIAACREQTMIGHYRDYANESEMKFDGKKYCAYYTQEEVKELVKYAAERYITIIPEIEMPGHSSAVLSAYPQYSCRKSGVKAACTWGVFDDVLCCNDSTFAFIEDILSEVSELFDGKYIHIGGDECPKVRWKECPVCQKTKQDNGLKDEHELQSYFIRTIEKFLNSKGKSIIGWDEILEGGVTQTATIMSWRGNEGGIAAAKAGNDAIMTPENYLYFNWYQADPKTEPLAFGGLTPLEKVYNYNPLPDALSTDEQKHIIGLQANTWSEYIADFSLLMYMDYPRTLALAEIGWTDKKNLNYDKFLESWENFKPFYKKLQQGK